MAEKKGKKPRHGKPTIETRLKRLWLGRQAGKLGPESLVDHVLKTWSEEIESLDAFIRKTNREVVPSEPIQETGNKFHRFCKMARDELVRLTEYGSNPVIIVALIVEDDAWHPLGVAPAYNDYERELVRFSSPEFWKQVRHGLKRIKTVLGDFSTSKLSLISHRTGGTAGDQYPLAEVLSDLVEMHYSASRNMERIDDLKLARKGRSMNLEGMFIRVERTSEDRPAGKRGRIRQHNWEVCAYRLWRYLDQRTKRPRWPSIARLLYAAGIESLYGVAAQDPNRGDDRTTRTVEQEAARVRRRVKALRFEKGDDDEDLFLRSLEEQYGVPKGAVPFAKDWKTI